MQASVPGHFLAPEPEPVKSLEDAFDLLRALAWAGELLQICLYARDEKLALSRPEEFNQRANGLLYTFTVVSDVMHRGDLGNRLATRYTSPVHFGPSIASTCYAMLTNDVALAQVKVVEDYWREIHGGKIVHVALNPQYGFDADQVGHICRLFERLKAFAFPGSPDEQINAIRAVFGELIVGLRQEQAWATREGITLSTGVQDAVGGVDCLVTLQQAAAMVNRHKRTLERYKAKMPAPRVQGGGGKADEWAWAEIRPWLEERFERPLPERFPADRFRSP